MSIANVQTDIRNIASTLSLAPVEIPAELLAMPQDDAIHHCLKMHVVAIGGYEALARALPAHSPKVWQGKIERIGRRKLLVKEFLQLIDLFGDMVLVALTGPSQGHGVIDLRSIPESEYSMADLGWAFHRNSAQVMFACCDLRESALDGTDTATPRAELARWLRETTILLRQMQLAMHAKLLG